MFSGRYGGINGFNQAIELSADTLGNVKFLQEKKLIGAYFDEISQDTGKFCFGKKSTACFCKAEGASASRTGRFGAGVADTMLALEMGAVEKLIMHEDLKLGRYVLKNSAGDETIKHLTEQQAADASQFVDKDGTDLETESRTELVEWMAENFKQFGCTLDFVTDNSQEGSQFVRGFGGTPPSTSHTSPCLSGACDLSVLVAGIGGILRWQVDFTEYQVVEDVEDEEYGDDDDDIDLDAFL